MSKPQNLNKKYYILDNIDFLHKKLQEYSMAELAKLWNIKPGSIRWIVKTKFTDEQRKTIKWERRPHKNRVKSKTQ